MRFSSLSSALCETSCGTQTRLKRQNKASNRQIGFMAARPSWRVTYAEEETLWNASGGLMGSRHLSAMEKIRQARALDQVLEGFATSDEEGEEDDDDPGSEPPDWREYEASLSRSAATSAAVAAASFPVASTLGCCGAGDDAASVASTRLNAGGGSVPSTSSSSLPSTTSMPSTSGSVPSTSGSGGSLSSVASSSLSTACSRSDSGPGGLGLPPPQLQLPALSGHHRLGPPPLPAINQDTTTAAPIPPPVRPASALRRLHQSLLEPDTNVSR
jgi:hypothetical protein